MTDRHKRIGLIPGVKVRLGRIAFSGEQKGVDLKLGLDMVGIARNRAASVAFLVSGDDDLAEAVEDAQDLGVKVVLIGLEKPDHRLGVASVAEHLALQVDSIITLPPDLIESCITKQVAAEPIPAPAAPAPAVPLPEAPVTVARPHPVPTPGKPKPPILTPGSRFQRSESQVVFTSSATGSSGAEGNPMDVAYEVGASLATNWYGSVTQNDVNELLADRPILPPEIDRVLLKDCAQRIGEWKTDIQAVRRTLRLAFWEKLDELI